MAIKNCLYGAVLLLMMAATACKKSNSNSWTFQGVTYSVDAVTITGNMMQAYNNYSQSYLSFVFNTRPTASGSYRIVSNTYPAPREVNLIFGTLAGVIYTSTGSDSINAAVTVTNGKVSVSVPAVWMGAYSDSSKLTAHISQ